jgi:hypothetical protein
MLVIRAALVLGYAGAEGLITDMSEGVLCKWLEAGHTFAEIPLLLSSPSLLRLMLQTGHQPRLYQARTNVPGTDNDKKSIDATNLRDVAADQFISRHRAFILPQLLIQIVSNTDCLEAGVDFKSRILQDHYIKEFCVCLRNSDDEETVRAVFQSRLHEIEAFCAPMIHSKSEDLGKNVIKLVDEFLRSSSDETASLRPTKPHLTVRRILELSGKDHTRCGQTSLVKESFLEAISSIADKQDSSRLRGDILSAAGTSLTECFLYVREWLEKATLPSQKEMRWSTISILFDLIFAQLRRKQFSQTQLAFGINVVVDIILDNRLRCIHIKALDMLKRIHIEVLGPQDIANLEGELSHVYRRLVGSLMKIHEENQTEFLSFCVSQAETKRKTFRNCLGFLRGIDLDRAAANDASGDAWGWDSSLGKTGGPGSAGDVYASFLKSALKIFQSEAPRSLSDTISGTYDLLRTIFDNAQVLGLSQESFVGCMPPFSISSSNRAALEETDVRFCAQKMSEQFLEGMKGEQGSEWALSASIRSLLGELRNRFSWMDSVMDSVSGNAGASRQDPSPNLRQDSVPLSMAQWMLRAQLVQLEYNLRRLRIAGRQELSEEDAVSLVHELAFVCGAPCPKDLRSAASRCLGELDLRLVPGLSTIKPSAHLDWIESSLKSGSLLRGIQAHALGVLAEYLQATHPGVAIAAIDTLIALLATSEGAECWELLENKTKQLLTPILPGKKRRTKVFTTTKAKGGKQFEELSTALCWNESLWQCRSGSKSSFEGWICKLVPALIECCYEDGKGRESNGAFFRVCQRIGGIAPGFASALFPAIVLDLLQRSCNTKASSSSILSSNGQVSEDTWIADADSFLHQQLSSCFETLLSSPTGDPSLPDTRATALAVDTLDLLRRATLSRFLLSDNHKRNPNATLGHPGQGKKSSKKSRSSRSPKNASESEDGDGIPDFKMGVGDVVHWKGVLFGTVLRLDGSLVIQACIRIQRFASALFYSDLYFESSLKGSGAIMEKLSNDFLTASAEARHSSQTDVSGYCLDMKECDSSVIRQRAISSLHFLGDCYRQLYDDDAYQAVQRQASDLRHSAGDSMEVENDESGRVLFPSLHDLQRLDAVSNLTSNPIETSLQTVEALEFLGLRNILQNYIGVMDLTKVADMPELDRRRLRDKWFESRLYGMNWDSSLLDSNRRNAMTSSTAETNSISMQARKAAVLGEVSQDEMGFHEAFTKGLEAYARDDLQSFHGLLNVARSSLQAPISALATGESSMGGLSSLIERLQSLNDIENLAAKPESADSLLKSWGFSMEVEDSGVGVQNSPMLVAEPSKMRLDASYTSAGFLPYFREIVLRLFRYKSAEKPMLEHFDPQQCLIEHFWHVSSGCRKMKHQSVAEAALHRMRAVVQSGEGREKTSLEIKLRQRLEEACLMESKGDFASAIRFSKQAITRLNEEIEREQSSGLESLLIDLNLQCGAWVYRYKTEPARNILKSYHRLGADMAKSLFKASKSPENCRRHLRAQIALASLASNLYDTVSARVKTLEWVKAGKSLEEREFEYKHCATLVKEAARRVEKAKKKRASEKELLELTREVNEIKHYGSNLLAEIQLAQRARNKTENSVKEYLELAMKSFASALSITGVGEGIDMSRHVFRMVFLWLSSCSEGNDGLDVNAIMDEALDNIPSFRFVPLTSQIFAQIDQIGASKFQKTLQNLVTRMCRDHPYHCLVQLISVCNGKEVGSGVSGRNASAFLENMSETKVGAANEIARALRTAGTSEFVSKLLENYMTLMSAYIQLANAPTAELVERRQTKSISLSVASKTQRLDRCLTRRSDFMPCVLTSPPPLRSGCDYGDGVEDPIGGERVEGFESTFSITDSGLHRPKIVICRGSKGGRYRQLVKGEDEIRQDAVMEQVFTYVNELMRGEHNADPRSQNLRMVTYNIIPLSPASGVSVCCSSIRRSIVCVHIDLVSSLQVLEWVENSMTFGDYILDTRDSKNVYKLGSHSRYASFLCRGLL